MAAPRVPTLPLAANESAGSRQQEPLPPCTLYALWDQRTPSGPKGPGKIEAPVPLAARGALAGDEVRDKTLLGMFGRRERI